jgi:hypothetical protein
MRIIDIRHPTYMEELSSWTKLRLVYESGDAFIGEYLEHFERRESLKDFQVRRAATYSPGFAKLAVNEIRNKFYLRSHDITRAGGSLSYLSAVDGREGGVDKNGSSMSYFICNDIIKELLVMRRVGIYVDMPPLDGPTLRDKQNKHPYCYFYPIEDILSWSYDENRSLSSLLLRDYVTEVDPLTRLPKGSTTQYRHLYLEDNILIIDFYNKDSIFISKATVNIPVIPFEMPTIPYSVIADAANYQIALLNIESSDINHILTANFPFYTEQYNPTAASSFVKGETQEVSVGVTKGRRYAKDLERPAFISPSTEPLKASMEKAKELKDDIRRLVNLAVEDLKGNESNGLSYLAQTLEHVENRIAEYWGMYESEESATVIYPVDYNYFDIETRTKEIDKNIELADSIASPIFKKEICKRITRLALSNFVPIKTIYEIENDIY